MEWRHFNGSNNLVDFLCPKYEISNWFETILYLSNFRHEKNANVRIKSLFPWMLYIVFEVLHLIDLVFKSVQICQLQVRFLISQQ